VEVGRSRGKAASFRWVKCHEQRASCHGERVNCLGRRVICHALNELSRRLTDVREVGYG